MAINERESALLDQFPPNRRDFVKRVLAGAAFAVPVVATFSIENLFVDGAYAQCSYSSSSSSSAYAGGPHALPEPGYVGPAVFQAFVSDNSGNTLVNGEVILSIDNDHDHHAAGTTLNVRVRLTKDASVSSVSLSTNCSGVANVDLHAADDFGHHDLVGSIGASNITGFSDFDSLLRALAAQQITATVQGAYLGVSFNAQGAVSAASASPIVQING